MKAQTMQKQSFGLIYIPLVLVFLAVMFYFKDSQKIQLEIIIASAIIYVAMALAHHHFDKSLTFEIIVEYILLALLVIILLSGQLI